MAIMAIIALGCGFFAGLKAVSPDMKLTADKYYEDTKLMDFHLLSTLGFDEEEAEKIGEIDGVSDFYAGYTSTMFFKTKDTDFIAKLYSFDMSDTENAVNQPTLTEGRMPQTADECLVDAEIPSEFQIGDKITFMTNDNDNPVTDTLNTDTFTIVGKVRWSMYIDFDRGSASIGNGVIDNYVLIPDESFCLEYYTDVFATLDEMSGISAFSDEYSDIADEKEEYLKEKIKEIGEKRFNSLCSDGEAEIADAEGKYEDGLDEYNTALADFNTQISDAEAEIEKNEALLEDNRKKYDAQYMLYKNVLDDFPVIKAQLEAAATELESGESALADARAELESNRESGKRELDEAKEELDSALLEIDDGKEKLEKLKNDTEYYAFDRNYNIGYSTYGEDSDKIDSIAKVFPVFFILIAALVCLNTMTRMVEEQRTEIGTLKALGYGNAAIIMQYLVFLGLASVIGVFLGVTVCFNVFPMVIFEAYSTMYRMPDVICVFRWDYTVGCLIASLLCTGLSSAAACRKELASVPAMLMRPKPPKHGKRVFLERIGFVWKRLSFNIKITVRNIARYKSRVFMTVIGVGGCTALMLTGFGLKHSISAIVDLQYGEIFVYDMQMFFEEGSTATDIEKLNDTVANDEDIVSHVKILQKTMDASANDILRSVYVIAAEDYSKIDEFIKLENRKSGAALSIDDNGVIISEKLSRLLKVEVGDSISLGERLSSVTVSGITENYAFNYVYFTSALYEECFGELLYNGYVCNIAEDTDTDMLSERLLENDNILTINYTSDIGNGFRKLVKSLNYVVLLIIISSAALAFVVLYNLANINITERVRELATIKVLGFYDKEVSSYIYRESTVSAVGGMLLGLFGGIYLKDFVVRTSEVDMVMFAPTMPADCFVYSALLTVVFTLTVNIALYFKLRKIDMAASMKAIE